MTQMTKSTLLHIDAGEGGDANFGAAKTDANNALVALERSVWQPLKAGTVWHGVGQPDAESVVHANVLALDIAKAMMEAGEAAMSTATMGFNALQMNLDYLNSYAKSMGLWVNEDGTVVWDEHKPHNPTEAYDKQAILNLQQAVQLTLKKATALDLSTKASLQVVYEHAPEVVDNASDAAKALPKNKQMLVDALDSKDLILEVATDWSLIGESLIGVGDLKAAGNHPLPDGVAKQLSQLDNLIIEFVGLGDAGPILNAIKGDIPSLLVDGIAFELEAIGKSATAVGEEVMARVAELGGRFIDGVNIGMFAVDVIAYAAGKFAPEGYPTSHPVVDHNGNVKASVNDFQLSHIAAHYYDNSGYDGGTLSEATVADLARAQQLGATDGGPVDYVHEATNVRDELQHWLDTHKDLSGDDPDRRYAEGLLADLNEAIDGPKVEQPS